jgi:hypothetical protein
MTARRFGRLFVADQHTQEATPPAHYSSRDPLSVHGNNANRHDTVVEVEKSKSVHDGAAAVVFTTIIMANKHSSGIWQERLSRFI